MAAAMLLCAGAACTSLVPAGDCADAPCPEGQACDPATRLCVLDLSPRITVVAPERNAAVKDAVLEVRGTVVTWSDATLVGVSYQLTDAGVAGGVPVDAGVFAVDVPLPPLDGVDTELVLLARDSQSRERRVSVPVRVDDVPPNPRFSPAEGERGADVQLTIDFGEAVTGPAVPAVLTPGGAAGSYDAEHRRFVVGGLLYDTGYRVTVDAGVVLDAFGHPNLPAESRFWTGAHPARTGAIAGLGAVVSFDATSDEDGVVTLAVETSDKVVWGWFRPSDGAFEQLTLIDVPAPPLSGLRASAAFQADGGDPLRVAVIRQLDAVPRIDVRIGGTFGNPSAAEVVPTGPSCAETSASLGSLGLVDGAGTYTRGPYSLALGFVPDRLAVRSEQFWEAVATDAQHRLRRAWFHARCGGTPSQEVHVEPPSRFDLADQPRFSLALARADRSLLVFDTRAGTRVESCQACEDAPDAGSCPPPVERTAAGSLTVASRHDGARVVGARRNDSGLVELLERDLSVDCGSPWTVLAAAPGSGTAIDWRPVMFGRKPGLLYSTATDIQVYVP